MEGHFHIVSEVPGFVDSDDTYCVNTVEFAGEAVSQEIAKLAVHVADGCDRYDCGVCPWCVAARSIAAQASDLAVLTAAGLDLDQKAVWHFDVPANPRGVYIHAADMVTAREDCYLAYR